MPNFISHYTKYNTPDGGIFNCRIGCTHYSSEWSLMYGILSASRVIVLKVSTGSHHYRLYFDLGLSGIWSPSGGDIFVPHFYFSNEVLGVILLCTWTLWNNWNKTKTIQQQIYKSTTRKTATVFNKRREIIDTDRPWRSINCYSSKGKCNPSSSISVILVWLVVFWWNTESSAMQILSRYSYILIISGLLLRSGVVFLFRHIWRCWKMIGLPRLGIFNAKDFCSIVKI